jgi:excisionase family DNA binding protein
MEILLPGQTGRSQLPKRGYRVNEFCQAVGISRASVYELIKHGRLKSVRICGRRIIPVDEAERVLREGA